MGEFNEIMRNAKGSFRKVRGFDPNKRKKNITKLVIALVVLLVAVIAIYFKKEIKNQLKLSSTKPTKHYLEIERKYVEKRINEYNNLVKIYNERLDSQENNRTIKARLEYTPDFVEGFFNAKGIDTFGITSGEVEVNTAADDNGKSLSFATKINNTDLLSGLYYNDKTANKEYFKLEGIEGISDKYVELNNDASNSVPGTGSISLGSKNGFLNNSFADAIIYGEKPIDYTESLKKLFDIYFKFVEESDSVQRSSKSLEINGLSNDYNVFTVNLSGEQVCDLAVKILEEAKKDENMSELVLKFADQVYACVDFESDDDSLLSTEVEPTDNAGRVDSYITKFNNAKEKAKLYGDAISIYTYSDITDKALGHDFVFKKMTDKIMELKSIMALKNGRFAAEVLYSKDNVDRISLKAYGPDTFRSTVAAAELTYGDAKDKTIVKVNIDGCDTLKLKQGVFEGKVTFASEDMYRGGKMIADVSLDVDKLVFNSNFYEGGTTTGYLNLSVGLSKVPHNTKPGANDKIIKSNDMKAMAKYLEDFNIKKFINTFSKKAKLNIKYEEIALKYPIITLLE